MLLDIGAMKPTSAALQRARSHRDLIVWQKAIDLAVAVSRVARSLPAIEKYALAHQMRTASVSIAANIAEGRGRATAGTMRAFLALHAARLENSTPASRSLSDSTTCGATTSHVREVYSMKCPEC